MNKTNRVINLGLIQWSDPFDRKAMSGTPYKMAEALRAVGFNVVWVPAKKTLALRMYTKAVNLLNKFSRKQTKPSHTKIGASLLSGTLDRTIIDSCDVLFAPMASECIFRLRTDKPLIYLSDATFAIMVDYCFHNLSKRTVRQGNMIERNAIDLASEVVVSSRWAAESVVADYHKDPSKIHVIEFGANIDEKDIVPRTFRYNGHLDLLFLGVDWVRKGGWIAVDICRWLNENGIPSTLHIVGVRNLDPAIRKLSFVDYVGFLNKNIPEEYKRLVDLTRLCHCMLLPTLAECSAIAFCESSANGLPVFSHLTGGVADYICEGENGHLLPFGSSGEDFGRKIKQSLESGELERMSVTSRLLYRQKLNWNIWGQRMAEIIARCVDGNSTQIF